MKYRYKPKMERKADMFAGKGSVAGKMKKRREMIEMGDPSGGRPMIGGDNSADEVLKRGYFKEEKE